MVGSDVCMFIYSFTSQARNTPIVVGVYLAALCFVFRVCFDNGCCETTDINQTMPDIT